MKAAIVNAHNQHVMNLTLDFSFFMNQDGQLRGDLVDAAMIHDQGKLLIPDEILLKPGRLTPEEWATMKTHVEHSVAFARKRMFNDLVIRYIQDHHENYDGSGYPLGLKGSEISIGGRILRICDVFAALTESETIRPYRHPITPLEALEIMWKDSKWFDVGLLSMFDLYVKSSKTLSISHRKLVAIV